MSVEQLIALLKPLPPDWEVVGTFESPETDDLIYGICAVRRDTFGKEVFLELENYE